MSTPTQPLQESKLPRRDWLIIPAICVLTAAAVAGLINAVAQHNYTEFDQSEKLCKTFVDPAIGIRRAASCTYTEKTLETPPTTFTLNDRGYREETNFPAKTPGTFRIVLVGTSFGFGLGTPKDQIIAARLPIELSQLTGRKVELYNEALPGFPGLPQNLPKRFDDILAAQPDLILWQMTRWDIKADQAGKPDPPDVRQTAFTLPAGTMDRVHTAFHHHSPKAIVVSLAKLGAASVHAAKSAFLDSTAAFMLRSWLSRSETQFLSSYLGSPDNTSGYLRVHQTKTWEENTALFDSLYRVVQQKAADAHIPMALVVWPSRAQASMIAAGEWDPAYDPYRLTRDIGNTVRRNGGTYLDIFPDMRTETDPGRGYLPIDGHPNGEGFRMLSHDLALALTSGAVPELTASKPPQADR